MAWPWTSAQHSETTAPPLPSPSSPPADCLPSSPPPQRTKDAPPVLSAEKGAPAAEKPLDFLVQRFAVDPTTKWRRTYALGGKSELLAVVRGRGGGTRVAFQSPSHFFTP